MKPYHLFFMLFAVLGLLFGYGVWNVGLLKPVHIESKILEPGVFIYRHVVGPYHNLSQEFTKLEDDFRKLNLDCKKTFGLYYDDPSSSEHERLRADIGCYQKTPPLQKVEGFEVKEVLPIKALTGKFDGAPWLTAFKVYGALHKKAAEDQLKVKQGPVLEIYEPTKNGFSTEVVFELEN